MKLAWLAGLALAFTMVPGSEVAAQQYAAGQVWEYETRPQDNGSLLKIQQVETIGSADDPFEVHHVSVIGVRLRGDGAPIDLPHFPVSRDTLAASVTRQIETDRAFPDPAEGIAIWRSDENAGVFTIPVKDIIDFVEQVLAEQHSRQQ